MMAQKDIMLFLGDYVIILLRAILVGDEGK